MRAVPYPYASDPHRASPRRRIITFALVVAVHVLMMLVLLRLAPPPSRPPKFDATPLVVNLMPAPRPAAARTKAAAKATRATNTTKRVAPPKPPVAPVAVTPVTPLAVIPLTSAEMAAADISKMPSRPAEQPGTEMASGAGTGRNGDSTRADGKGPGGEALYNAEWHREPTDAELGFYFRDSMPRTGWALIACRTVPNFRVEDCVELGQSPPGSGLAGAIRQAAWQFRVRPPRLGGRPRIGEWVRIRIDFNERTAK